MIDTKALRSRVLDLAIQGKLTEQLVEDGTAEELYAEIQSEKQRLIKEGKLKKEKPLPEIKPEEVPFEIPNTWKWIRHNDLFEVSGGSQPSKAEFINEPKEGYIRLYQIRDYGNNPVPVYIPMIYASKTTQKGDILLARYGASLGKVFIAEEGAYNVAMAKVIFLFESTLIDKNYLFWYYRSKLYQNAIMMMSRSAQAGFNKDDLNSLLFLLPPLAEQKRIVARVEEIFRLLDTIDAAQEQYAADAESLKAKLITTGIQGKLTEQLAGDGTAEELYQQIQAEKQRLIKEGKIKKEKPLPEIKPEEVPFEIPENWKWVRLKSLGQFSSGKTPSMSEPAFWNGSIAWVTSKDMKRTIITDSEMHITDLAAEDMKIHPAGTLLLVARSGILRHSLPLCVLGVDSTINQDIKAFSLHDLSLSKWVYYALKGLEPLILKDYVKAMTTVESLKFEEFSSMPIPLPPLAEQKRIADRLEELLGALS